MKILMDGNTSAKVQLGCLLDQIICNMMRRLAFSRVFFRDQFSPLVYVIDFILDLEFFLERELVRVQLPQPFSSEVHCLHRLFTV